MYVYLSGVLNSTVLVIYQKALQVYIMFHVCQEITFCERSVSEFNQKEKTAGFISLRTFLTPHINNNK